jgi:hypothetical protein
MEFNRLVELNEAADTLLELRGAIQKLHDTVFNEAKGSFSLRMETAVIAVCRKYHLNYYRGQGRNLNLQ